MGQPVAGVVTVTSVDGRQAARTKADGTVGATEQDANAAYSLGSSPGESARLQRQAAELAADSTALLDRVSLRPGQRAIDLGCGPRGALDILAERVTPAGRAVGLDADPAHTAMAAEFAAERGLSCVEIITADAMATGLPTGSFDLVHARLLLVNLPNPAEVAAEMVRLAKPGGWVASAEADMEHALCYPPHPAFDRLSDIFTVAFRRNGADPWLGRRVPGLFRQAGLEDVNMEARMMMYPPGAPARPSAWTWCAACARGYWRWSWPAPPTWTSWTRPPARISPIRAR
jgi:SAM-dependent methyltransferase